MAMPSEYDDIALPPVYENSLIITQPQRNGMFSNNPFLNEQQNERILVNFDDDNNRQENTNIPILMSWISSTRGFQTLPISPEYFLTNIEQVEIQPVVDENNTNRQYRVWCPERSETLFLATEISSKWQKKILGSMRHLNLILRDVSGATAFTLTKSKMTIETPTEIIGYVEQNFTFFGVNFSIHGVQDNQCIVSIVGPIMFCCCCTRKNVNFHIVSSNGRKIIGSIMYQWDYLRLDYILVVTFVTRDMNEKMKSLILGAAFLLESLYFAN
ncbi:hypothetical protein PV327_006131 [Microctonus hyperodae]|uniref:Phospholipid scramblase n=1 Tax=Microctonus hyperodae TaxID=165561 RepID=A0AA39G364_MICHY|nr:hypothetical protein PV327_006131 [Microctonus hyperodae]